MELNECTTQRYEEAGQRGAVRGRLSGQCFSLHDPKLERGVAVDAFGVSAQTTEHPLSARAVAKE